MYRFDGNTIFLTRGDTLRALVSIKQNDDIDYTPVEGDVIRFALKRRELNAQKTEFLDKKPLVVKEIPKETLLLKLDPADTANLPFGVYKYDIQLTSANGDVDTFISDELHLELEVC